MELDGNTLTLMVMGAISFSLAAVMTAVDKGMAVYNRLRGKPDPNAATKDYVDHQLQQRLGELERRIGNKIDDRDKEIFAALRTLTRSVDQSNAETQRAVGRVEGKLESLANAARK